MAPAALATLPVLGPMLGLAAGKVASDPRAAAKTILQVSFTVGVSAWIIFGLNGRRIAAMTEDRTFDCAAFELTGTPVTSSGAGDSGSGSSGSSGGSGQDTMAKAADEAGVPASWADADDLWSLLGKESSSTRTKLNPTAQNPSSSAYGIFQFLDSTWGSVGGSKTSDPYKQSVYGLKYIKQRYGTPTGAWNFWNANGWY